MFAERKGKSFVFSANPAGRPIRASLDFKEEYKQRGTFEPVEVENLPAGRM